MGRIWAEQTKKGRRAALIWKSKIWHRSYMKTSVWNIWSYFVNHPESFFPETEIYILLWWSCLVLISWKICSFVKKLFILNLLLNFEISGIVKFSLNWRWTFFKKPLMWIQAEEIIHCLTSELFLWLKLQNWHFL